MLLPIRLVVNSFSYRFTGSGIHVNARYMSLSDDRQVLPVLIGFVVCLSAQNIGTSVKRLKKKNSSDTDTCGRNASICLGMKGHRRHPGPHCFSSSLVDV